MGHIYAPTLLSGHVNYSFLLFIQFTFRSWAKQNLFFGCIHTPPYLDMSTNTTCPLGGNSLPEFNALAIPANLTTTFIPGSNASDKVMTACCAPNTVHIASSCYEWCEVPSSRLHNLSRHDIEDDMIDCLQAHGWSVNQSS